MRLDHVNIRTARLDDMRRWYVAVIGLVEGWRPPFAFPGTWLYAGDQAVVHLIGVETAPLAGAAANGELALEHFAFTAGGPAELAAFRARLAAAGITPRELAVPGTDLLQLNIHDPDGNHIHVDFRVPQTD